MTDDQFYRTIVVGVSNGLAVLAVQYVRKRFPRERITSALYLFGLNIGRRLRAILRKRDKRST